MPCFQLFALLDAPLSPEQLNISMHFPLRSVHFEHDDASLLLAHLRPLSHWQCQCSVTCLQRLCYGRSTTLDKTGHYFKHMQTCYIFNLISRIHFVDGI